MRTLQNAVVVITGASSGIGQVTAHRRGAGRDHGGDRRVAARQRVHLVAARTQCRDQAPADEASVASAAAARMRERRIK